MAPSRTRPSGSSSARAESLRVIPATSCEIYNWEPSIPVVLRAAHSPRCSPEERVPARDRGDEDLRLRRDGRTDQLALVAAELGAAVLVYRLVHFFLESGDSADPAEKTRASKDRLAATTAEWTDLRRKADACRKAAYKWFHPYWRPLDQLVERVRDVLGVCVVIDLSWCCKQPLLTKWERDHPRPEVLIGTNGYTPGWLARIAEDACVERGLSPVQESGRRGFYGPPYVPLMPRVPDHPVWSMLLEARDDIYLDDRPDRSAGAGDRMMEVVSALVAGAARRAPERIGRRPI